MSNNLLFGGSVDELGTQKDAVPRRSATATPQHQIGDYGLESHPMTLADLDLRRPQFKSSFLESEPHTPVEQIPSQPYPPYDNKNRFGSVSSIATTDDEDAGGNEIVYPWNDQQDELVKEVYEDLLASPQLTPFSGRYPPSGVLHRVAKDSLRLAKHKQIYFPHSMNAVRQRLIQSFQNESENNQDLGQCRMPNDYFSIPLSSDSDAGDPGDFDFTDAMGPSGGPRRRISVEEKYGQRQLLQPAFREPTHTTLTEEDVVNIVAKRKRDSLRIKRGPH